MTGATICTIGDEILIGQIVDTNSAYIAQQLNQNGVKVNSILSIADHFSTIIEELRTLTKENSVVIITGGLGPTKDDITKRALAALTESDGFKIDQTQLEFIRELFAKRGMGVSQLNHDQALVPSNCRVINNRRGTAPGMVFKYNGALLFSLPGVPYEMEALMEKVVKIINENFESETIFHRTITTFGIPESTMADMLKEWEESLPSTITLAYLPNPLIGIRLRLSIYGGVEEENSALIARYLDELKELLGEKIIYGEEGDTLPKVLAKVLNERNMTLSVAESCTGGTLSAQFVALPGSSSFYNGGVTSYSNHSKIELLGVDPSVIEQYGAVSRECAEAMAIGAKERFNSNVALSTTGIAGPTGGDKEKPVGTLWVAVATEEGVFSKKLIMNGDRERNIIRFTSNALFYLRNILLGIK